jgi:hypothetical protein
MRNDAVLPEPAHLLGFVILEITLEPFDVAVAFEGQDVLEATNNVRNPFPRERHIRFLAPQDEARVKIFIGLACSDWVYR